MVSSTFTDLADHRKALTIVINSENLKPVAMEFDYAKPDSDVIDSSLQMVRDAAAYVCLISHTYGQVPECPVRNPNSVSLTELEFDEATRLGRPVLLFVMGRDHLVRPAAVETDPSRREKLEAFRERAKHHRTDSPVQRVYYEFNSLSDFEVAAVHSVADLRRRLNREDKGAPGSTPRTEPLAATIPSPPLLYAEPPYMGSHAFIGRRAQLEALTDWARAADPNPVLLFDAIGGTGKSMLTWEWTTLHATSSRSDWAGRFWYSFYTRGSVLSDFCRRALAYMTDRPYDEFRKIKLVRLGQMLLEQLQRQPWLLVLDGLERVLVAYHRFDAAQLADEDAGREDQIGQRDTCSAIRPEDDDLLRALSTASPSKLLVTTRLMPRVLLNKAHQPIPGVRRESLPGLRPADAETLLRACGVDGTSAEIQRYLQEHCDCHPLVIGAIGGLVNDYLPNRGIFDSWSADPDHGGHLDLASLDLVQKRNHILHAALAALPSESRRLLGTLALLSEPADYSLLAALNPHRPRTYRLVARPMVTGNAVDDGGSDESFRNAEQALIRTVREIESRGLLQYDAQARRYDLHPVVRGVVAGSLVQEERELFGQTVVDHFSSRDERTLYESAQTLEDVSHGLQLVRALLQMGRFDQAAQAFVGDLSQSLRFNLEAFAEVQSLLRPFFPQGFSSPISSEVSSVLIAAQLWNAVGGAFFGTGYFEEAIDALGRGVRLNLAARDWSGLHAKVYNVARCLIEQNRLATAGRITDLTVRLSERTIVDHPGRRFGSLLLRFRLLLVIGAWTDAEKVWTSLEPLDRPHSRAIYRPGDAEGLRAELDYRAGMVTADTLLHAEKVAGNGNNRKVVRLIRRLHGIWLLDQARWEEASERLQQVVGMAHETGQMDSEAEAWLALAKHHLGRLTEPTQEAERLSAVMRPPHLALARLWEALGEAARAERQAVAAYRWACADGEPYLRRFELERAAALLTRIGVAIPEFPPYDPSHDVKLAWEEDVNLAIERWINERQASSDHG